MSHVGAREICVPRMAICGNTSTFMCRIREARFLTGIPRVLGSRDLRTCASLSDVPPLSVTSRQRGSQLSGAWRGYRLVYSAIRTREDHHWIRPDEALFSHCHEATVLEWREVDLARDCPHLAAFAISNNQNRRTKRPTIVLLLLRLTPSSF